MEQTLDENLKSTQVSNPCHIKGLLLISDHLRRAESFRKDSKGFRRSKRVTQFIELNEFATKT
jgi:hypothetical protein